MYAPSLALANLSDTINRRTYVCAASACRCICHTNNGSSLSMLLLSSIDLAFRDPLTCSNEIGTGVGSGRPHHARYASARASNNNNHLIYHLTINPLNLTPHPHPPPLSSSTTTEARPGPSFACRLCQQDYRQHPCSGINRQQTAVR